MTNKATNFNIGSLLAYQDSTLGFVKKPAISVYNATDLDSILNHSVKLTESGIMITIDKFEKNYDGNQGLIDLRTVRHDLVANVLRNNTDMELSMLGISGEDSHLTPDYVDINLYSVLELSTSLSDNVGSLKDDFRGKYLKYFDVLSRNSIPYYVLVVSITTVVTNMLLTTEQVNELCCRLRTGRLIESIVRELISNDIFSNGDKNEDIMRSKIIFSSIKENSRLSSELYNFEEIKSMSEEPSESEKTIVSNILSKTFGDTKKTKTKIGRILLDNYLENFTDENSRRDMKRISNIPFVVMNGVSDDYISLNGDLPDHLRLIWLSSLSVSKPEIDVLEDEKNALYGQELGSNRHRWKRETTFSYKLTQEDSINLAKCGIDARKFEKKQNKEVLYHQKESKKSFHPDSNTQDISEFIRGDMFHKEEENNVFVDGPILKAIINSKQISTNGIPQNSLTIFESILKKRIIIMFSMVSEVFTEISYCYKHWVKEGNMIHRVTKSGIHLLIKPTGSHVFVSYAFPKACSKLLDPGKLGPTYYLTSSHIITDFCSYNEPTIEHFVKSGPYMTSLYIHMKSMYEIEPTQETKEFTSSFNLVSLLFVNNKLDAEEIMTSQRYFFMRLIEEVPSDPYMFVNRLPNVLRSRLTVYILKRTMYLMDYYNQSRIFKIPKKNSDNSGLIMYDYVNIKSICHDTDITLKQKINEFYFGYVISKEKARGGDRTYKIIEKVIKEEYEFREKVTSTFFHGPEPVKYCTSVALMKWYNSVFKKILEEKLGSDWKDVIEDMIHNNVAFSSFSDVATLKASSKDHSDEFEIPEDLSRNDFKSIVKLLKTKNKKEFSKRPKVIQALIELVHEYIKETGIEPSHLIDILPWCLNSLMEKGYFDSDLFPKSQHGGDREIHVLEIKARIVQYFLEKISKTLCGIFQSETLTHPNTKERFVRNHYANSNQLFEKFMTICKSADAQKWCQRHFVSHFSALLNSVLPERFRPFVLTALSLWPNKMISFPPNFVGVLLANKNVESNDLFLRFRNDFYKGDNLFTQPLTNKIQVKSGMMQGILHYTSSLYHTFIQEVSVRIMESYIKKSTDYKLYSTIVQGSDDSGMMISLSYSGENHKTAIEIGTRMLYWKELISVYFSVYPSPEKCSVGTVDLIEYNSEWHSRHQIIKPTFRWVSACMETNVVEKFIDRLRIFNNVLTQCLEGGSSTLEASVIQLSQCWMHYMLLGLHTSSLSGKFVDMLMQVCDPRLGFFPCDYDICAGVPGVEFQLYNLCSNGKLEIPSIQDDSFISYNYEGQKKSEFTSQLSSVKLRFGRITIWKELVDSLGLGTLESAIERIEENPLLVFGRHTSWSEETPSLILKVFSNGVKESISSRSPTLRMMASSAYILSTKCITYYQGKDSKKVSLYSLLKEQYDQKMIKSSTPSSVLSMPNISSIFPLHSSYELFSQSIQVNSIEMITHYENFKRTSKHKLIVFEYDDEDVSVIEACKRKWFEIGKVMMSRSQFQRKWEEYKAKFPFLRDTIEETKSILNITTVELKSFLESLELKTRTVVLHDSNSGHGGLEGSLSRIYWPNTKIRLDKETNLGELTDLRAKMFNLLTFWLTPVKTTQMVISLLRKCKPLYEPYASIPDKFKVVKLFHMWATSINVEATKMEIMRHLINMKKGNIGSFIVVQRGYGIERKGVGIWIGKVNGVNVKINLIDNSTEYIVVSELSDVRRLGSQLIDLVKDFNCMSSHSQKMRSDYYLTMSGKFVTTKNPDNPYIPVVIDSKFKVDIMKDMQNNAWSLQCESNKIRLQMSDPLSNTRTTILADNYTLDDWIPNKRDSSFDDVIGLNDWCDGKPFSMILLESEIRTCVDRNVTTKLLTNLKSLATSSGWSIDRFIKRLQSMTLAKDQQLELLRSQKYADRELLNQETQKEVQNILKLMNDSDDDDELYDSIINWADEVNESTDEDEESAYLGMDILDSDIDGLKGLIELMKTSFDNPDIIDDVRITWNTVHSSNKFFSPLDEYCIALYGMKFSKVLNEIDINPKLQPEGIVNILVSFCKKRLIRYDKRQAIDVEIFESATRSSEALSESLLTEESKLESIKLLEEANASHENTIKLIKNDKFSAETVKHLSIQIEKNRRRLEYLKGSSMRGVDMLKDIAYSALASSIITNLDLFREYSNDIKLALFRRQLHDHVDVMITKGLIDSQYEPSYKSYALSLELSSFNLEVISDKWDMSITIGDFRIGSTRNIRSLTYTIDGEFEFEEQERTPTLSVPLFL